MAQDRPVSSHNTHGGTPPNTERVRSGQDASQEGLPSQSGPNRGTNTGTDSPGGVKATIGTTARAAQGRPGNVGTSDRKGAVRIPGAGRGATKIDGMRRGKGG